MKKSEEEKFIDGDPEAVVDQYEAEGLEEAIRYNLMVAEDCGLETQDWDDRILRRAILEAAKEAGRLRPEDKE